MDDEHTDLLKRMAGSLGLELGQDATEPSKVTISPLVDPEGLPADVLDSVHETELYMWLRGYEAAAKTRD